MKNPERLAIIKQRVGVDFDIVDVIQRLRLARFKFARTMLSYFKPQGLRQTPLVASFDSMFMVEGFNYTQKFLEECQRVLDHHRRTPFTFPGEREENPRIIAWCQGFNSSLGEASLTGGDFSYIQWLASENHREYVMRRMLADPQTLARDGASLLSTSSLMMHAHLTRELLRAGVSPYGEITVRYRDPSRNFLLDDNEKEEWSRPTVTTVWAVFLFRIAAEIIEQGLWNLERRSEMTEAFLVLEEFLSCGADSDAFFLIEARDGEGPPGPVALSLEDLILHSRFPNLNGLMKHILRKKGSWLWQGTKQVVAKAWPSWVGDTQRTRMEYRPAQVTSMDSIARKFIVQTVCVGNHRLERGFLAKWF